MPRKQQQVDDDDVAKEPNSDSKLTLEQMVLATEELLAGLTDKMKAGLVRDLGSIEDLEDFLRAVALISLLRNSIVE